MSIHSLIYDNTPSHNSPSAQPLPPPLPPPPPPLINPTAMATPHAKDYPVWASFLGYFYLMIASAGRLATIEWLSNGSVKTKVTPIYLFYLLIFLYIYLFTFAT